MQTLRMNHVGAVLLVEASDQVVGIVSNTDLLPKEVSLRSAGAGSKRRTGDSYAAGRQPSPQSKS